MYLTRKPWMGFLVILAAITLFVTYIQNQLLLNSDVSWLTHAAVRILKGGSYSTDFFETNPPLIIYLYMPLVFIKSLLAVSTFTALQIFIFILSFFSLIFCVNFLEKMFYEKDRILFYILISLFTFLFLIFPLNDIGQREHLLVILTTPYFLLMVARLEKNIASSPATVLIVGLLAAIGFAIKPFFYSAFAFVELYYVFYHQNLRVLFRLETILIAGFAILYLALIFLLHPDYINFILPLIIGNYYKKYSTSITKVFFKSHVIYFYIMNVFLLFYLCLPKIRYQKFLITFTLVNLGFFISYVSQRQGSSYHFIPVFSYLIILAATVFYLLATETKWRTYDWVLATTLFAVLCFFCNNHVKYIYFLVTFFPIAYFVLLTTVVTSLLLIADNSLIKTLFRVGIILILSVTTFEYLLITSLAKYRLAISMTLVLLAFLMLLPKKEVNQKAKNLFLACFGILIFMFPVYYFEDKLSATLYYDRMYKKLIVNMQDYQKKSVYYFTSTSEVVYPVIDYAHQKYVSRFWSMSWLPLMTNPEDESSYHNYYLAHKKEFDFYIDIILQDFAKHQPQYIFVDERKFGYYFNVEPDYIKLFSENTRFQQAWQNYHYVTVIDNKPLSRFAVYQRNL